MGLKNRPDKDINIEAINILMEKLEAGVMERGTTVEIRCIIKEGVLFHELFCGFIKGGGVIMMDT